MAFRGVQPLGAPLSVNQARAKQTLGASGEAKLAVSDQLRQEPERLRGVRAELGAAVLEQLAEEVDCQRRLRLQATEKAALLDRWDRGGDGRWSPGERQDHKDLAQHLGAQLQHTEAHPCWMLLADEELLGPMAQGALTARGDSPGTIGELYRVEGAVRSPDLRALPPLQPSSSHRRRPVRS
jgi:hypothetical protein